MLKATFISLLSTYTKDEVLINELWLEIEENYSGKKRYYHTLAHLENLLVQLLEVKDEIENWEVILYTLFYHDVIYNALRSDNEEKSAQLAKQRMEQLSVSYSTIEECVEQILATKSHSESNNSDTNYFLDADLSVIGQSWESYSVYYKNVRREYSIYPDLIYNPGRKKVVHHFLAMNRIFKTNKFYDKFEIQAKQNLQNELADL